MVSEAPARASPPRPLTSWLWAALLPCAVGAAVWTFLPAAPPVVATLGRARGLAPDTGGLRAPRCEKDMAAIRGEFCIDKYEASTESIDAEGRVLGPHTPYAMTKNERVRAVSRAGVHPQAHVTLVQARDACERAGKRLCTDREWLLACRGPEETAFPYGKEYDKTACNDRASSPFYKLFGSEPPLSVLASPLALNNPKLNQQGGLAKTGAFSRCVSGYGVHDMVGNLHEWTADPAGTFRGGYYRDARQHGPGCLYVTKGHDAHYRDYSIGFRCCSALR